MLIERVEADTEFYSKHEATFAAFLERVKSELNNPAHLAPLRSVKEADDGIEAVVAAPDCEDSRRLYESIGGKLVIDIMDAGCLDRGYGVYEFC